MIDIQIYDTTLRDGEQAPGAAMRPVQKVEIAMALQQMGVDTIEAGFPAASPDDACAFADIARECRSVRLAAFARTKPGDIVAAGEALRSAVHGRITLVMPASDLHVRLKLGMDYEQALTMLAESVAAARNLCAEVEVIAEDASRASLPFLCRIARCAIGAGACAVTVADTVGYATPVDIRNCLETLHLEVPELARVTLGIHCHDDLGLATINTLAGLEAGARQAHCTMNGIGERAGNAALEEVVMAMASRPDRFPFRSGLDTSALFATSKLVSEATGFVIPPNKAIVGGNAFAHGAGMHQDGMLKDSGMYEIFQPERVGAPSRRFPITRHSGRKGLAAWLAARDIKFSEDDLGRFFVLVKARLAEEPALGDDQLFALAGRFLQSPGSR